MTDWPQLLSAMMRIRQVRQARQAAGQPTMRAFGHEPMPQMPPQMPQGQMPPTGMPPTGMMPKRPGFVDDSGMAPPLPMAGKFGPVRRIDDSGMAPPVPMPMQNPQPMMPPQGMQGGRNPFLYGR
ncbi:MAG TPA: hypothetical protein VIY48_03620 [Candidatus Paceibacterota bacterium]